MIEYTCKHLCTRKFTFIADKTVMVTVGVFD